MSEAANEIVHRWHSAGALWPERQKQYAADIDAALDAARAEGIGLGLRLAADNWHMAGAGDSTTDHILALDKTAVESADRFVQDRIEVALRNHNAACWCPTCGEKPEHVDELRKQNEVLQAHYDAAWKASCDLERERDLLRAKLAEVQDKIDAERERCAKIAEGYSLTAYSPAAEIAAAIRGAK